MVLIARIAWHVASGMARGWLKGVPRGDLVHHPAIWKTRVGWMDCSWGHQLSEASINRYAELAIWHALGSYHVVLPFFQRGWRFKIGASHAVVHHPIRCFQALQAQTMNVYWDDEWYYMHARFHCTETGVVLAESLTRCIVKQVASPSHGVSTVNPRELFQLLNVQAQDKVVVPPSVRHLLNWDKTAAQHMKHAEIALQQKKCTAPKKPARVGECCAAAT